MILILLALLWLGCSFISYGVRFGYIRNEYKNIPGEYFKDMFQSLLQSIGGPFSLFGALSVGLAVNGENEKPRILKHSFKVI
jgi:hypothetical protein